MELDYAAIGERIKQLRSERKLSQEKLAELIDISVPHMSNVENGKAKFSMQILINLVNALNVTPNALLLGEMTGRKKVYPMAVQMIHQELEDCTTAQIVLLGEMISYTRQRLMQYDDELKEEEKEDSCGEAMF